MSALFLLIAAQTGAVAGTVRYEGTAPRPRPFKVDTDARTCGRSKIFPEDLVVRDGRLVNAVVIASMPPEVVSPREPAHLDQLDCTFLPHVQSMTHGTELIIGNSDPIIHNVHAVVAGETAFNFGMPLKGVSVKRTPDRIGVHSMQCDSGHWWMKAYAIVVPHRFHATTGADGTFRIDGLPPGTRRIAVWHERLGIVERDVEVRAGETIEVELSFSGEAAPDANERFDALLAGPPAQEPEPKSDPRIALEERKLAVQREAGALYRGHCATCHGVAGNGRGESTRFLSSRPRDFTHGEFKFRTTPSGRPATIPDLYRTITVGIPGTEMPSFARRLTKQQRELLAEMVLSLSPHWFEAHDVETIPIPEPPPPTPGAVERGRALYLELKCAQCHGPNGDGSGAEQRRTEAADLTKGYYRGGTGLRVIYRALTTGLSGSPMPAFLQVSDDQRWDLARYVESIGARSAGDWFLDPDVGRRSRP